LKFANQSSQEADGLWRREERIDERPPSAACGDCVDSPLRRLTGGFLPWFCHGVPALAQQGKYPGMVVFLPACWCATDLRLFVVARWSLLGNELLRGRNGWPKRGSSQANSEQYSRQKSERIPDSGHGRTVSTSIEYTWGFAPQREQAALRAKQGSARARQRKLWRIHKEAEPLGPGSQQEKDGNNS